MIQMVKWFLFAFFLGCYFNLVLKVDPNTALILSHIDAAFLVLLSRR